MHFKINYDEEKNLLLKITRGICFEDVLQIIKKNGIVDNLEHHNKEKYQNQKILVIKIKNYIYAVPYVINQKKKEFFLKTIYPSRALTEKYLKK